MSTPGAATTDPGPIPEFLQRKLTEYEIHPLALMFPPMVGSEFNELVEDIRKRGQLEPIRLYEGKVLEGRNRARACQQLRKEVRAVEYVGGDPKGYVIAMNVIRRHLTAEQKRELIAGLLKENPQASDRAIAEIVKASPTTVGTVRAGLEATGDVSKLDTRTDTTGRQQPANKPSTTNKSETAQGGGSTAGGGGPKRNPAIAWIKKDPLNALELAFRHLRGDQLAPFISTWKSDYACPVQVFALIERWEEDELDNLMDLIKKEVGRRMLKAKYGSAEEAEAEKAEAGADSKEAEADAAAAA